MTTATNIQMATNQATLTEANSDIKEAGKMNNEHNIHGINSLVSDFIRTNRATSIIAGLMIGGMIAAASMLPGNASADTPARPVGDPEAAVSTANTMDMDLLDPGFYDSKAVRTSSSTSAFDMDLLDPGVYNAKVVRSGTSAIGYDMDLLDPGVYNAKVVRSGTSAIGYDMDLLDPGIYNAKVVRSGNSALGFDMDLLDPGFYNAKVIRSGRSAHGFDMDLIDPGFYDAKVVRSSVSPSWEGLQEDNII